MSSLPPIQIVESADPLATPRRIALVRPDIRPAVHRREERWVMTFPHLIVREVILFQLVVIGLAVAAMLFDAPLQLPEAEAEARCDHHRCDNGEAEGAAPPRND